MTGRVNSFLGNKLSNGGVSFTAGKMIPTLFTNSILANGSGTALVKPDFVIDYAVDKNLSEPFNLLLTPLGQKDLNEARLEFTKQISEQLALIEGKVVEAREAVLTLGGRVLIMNKNYAAPVKVMGSSVSMDPIHDHILNITVKVKMIATDAMVKMRRPFTKFTTTPSSNFSITGNQDFDIILNLECTKGQGSLVEMYCNNSGVIHYTHMNKGLLENSETGEMIDLRDPENAVRSWVNSVATIEQLTVKMAKSHYELIKDVFFDGSGNLVDGIVSIDDSYNTMVLITEEVQVVRGELVYDVEISTARESVGTQELTLEQVSNLAMQDYDLGAALITQATDKADKLLKFASAFRNFTERNKAPMFDFMDAVSRNKFYTAAFGSVAEFRKYCVKNHREVFQKLATAYKGGVCFADERGSTSVISFEALAAFGHFSFNGSAAGEAGKILACLSAFAVPTLTTEEHTKLIKSIVSNYSKWINNLAESPSALKKAARAGRMVGGKVRTTFDPIVHSQDGVPVVVLNKACPIVKMLRLNDGDFVGVARTPMVSITVCRVRLTDRFNIAHVMIDPFVFHRGTEGDSDGDGVALLDLNVEGFEMTTERALTMNNSIVGPGGYEAVWKEVPYMEFMSHSDKLGKKAVIGNNTPFAATKLAGSPVNADDLGTMADLVGMHYRVIVGVSYGMCSGITFGTLSDKAQLQAN